VEEVEDEGDGRGDDASAPDDECLGVVKGPDAAVKFLDVLLLLMAELEEGVELSFETPDCEHDVVFGGHQDTLVRLKNAVTFDAVPVALAVFGAVFVPVTTVPVVLTVTYSIVNFPLSPSGPIDWYRPFQVPTDDLMLTPEGLVEEAEKVVEG